MRSLLLLAISATQAFSAVTADNVLKQMDEAAPKFNGMSANLSRLTYTKVIDDKSTETGTILVRKTGARDIQMMINITEPDAKLVAFRGRKAEIFYPKMKSVEEWDLGKHTDLVNQFLILGFGTSGRDLTSTYDVKYAGDETVTGQKTHKLELTPLSAQAKQNIRGVELWIDAEGAYPVQQKIVKPSRDYYLFTYTNVKINPPLTDEALRLKLPKGVKRVSPQK